MKNALAEQMQQTIIDHVIILVKENIDDKNPKNVKKQVSLDSKKGKK